MPERKSGPISPKEVGQAEPTTPKRQSGPISPKEVEQIKSTIPEEVFDAFNEIIAANWNGSSATFKQDDVMAVVMKKLKQRLPRITRDQVFERNWLDVEPAYRAKGWRVDYDKPGYCETYPATFTFEKRSR